SWGYCLCETTTGPTIPTESPTSNPTGTILGYEIMADGGGVSSPQACVFGGTVKLDTRTYTFSADSCEEVTAKEPFQSFTLKDPSDERTDTLRWCPIADPYNGKKSASPRSKREQWGYCLEKPITNSPTISPTTASPTLGPSES